MPRNISVKLESINSMVKNACSMVTNSLHILLTDSADNRVIIQYSQYMIISLYLILVHTLQNHDIISEFKSMENRATMEIKQRKFER